MYVGWESILYTNEIDEDKKLEISNELKRMFTGNGWLYSEDGDELVVNHRLIDDSAVIIVFKTTLETTEEDLEDVETYHLLLKIILFRDSR